MSVSALVMQLFTVRMVVCPNTFWFCATQMAVTIASDVGSCSVAKDLSSSLVVVNPVPVATLPTSEMVKQVITVESPMVDMVVPAWFQWQYLFLVK